MDSNLGPLVLVATTLATEPQPQTLNFFLCDKSCGFGFNFKNCKKSAFVLLKNVKMEEPRKTNFT